MGQKLNGPGELREDHKRGMSEMMIVFLTLFAVSNLVYSSEGDTRTCMDGRIQPKPAYFLERQDMVLECYSNRPANNLTFQIGTKRHHEKEQLIEFRNETYAKLVIPKVKAKLVKAYNSGRFVRCYDLSTDICMDNVFIELEYYPKKPQDIQCVMGDFRTLFCNWTLGIQYKFPQYITVTSKFSFRLQRHFRDGFSNWIPCPAGGGDWTSCSWNETQIAELGTFLYIGVLITVTNARQNITVGRSKRFKRDAIVKPFPIQQLTVNATQDPRCVLLSWEHMSERDYLVRITFQSNCDEIRKERVICQTMNCSHQTCGLIPHTVYNLSIESRFYPNDQEKGFWSHPSRLQFTTSSTIPAHSPVMTPGLFTYYMDGINLYWQPLTQCVTHSPNTTYEVEINGFKQMVGSSEFRVKIPINDTADSSDCYAVKVIARNSVGEATRPSIIEVCSQNQVPADSEFIVEYSRNDLGIPEYFGRVEKDNAILDEYLNISHTITWCPEDPLNDCKTPMEWLAVEDGANMTKIPVLNGREEYLFGLITKGYSKTRNRMESTDIHMAECIYELGKAPLKPLPKVYLSDVQLPNSVRVDWNPYKCHRSVTDLQNSVSFVENYIVIYCEADQPIPDGACRCKHNASEVAVSKLLQSYTVNNLPGGTGFCLWVTANNSIGRGPRNKNNLFHIVTAKSGTQISFIVLYSVSGLCVIAMVIFVVKKMCDMMKARLEKLKGVHDPHVVEDITLPMHSVQDQNGVINCKTVSINNIDETELYQEPLFKEEFDSFIGGNSRAPLLGYDLVDSVDGWRDNDLDSAVIVENRDYVLICSSDKSDHQLVTQIPDTQTDVLKGQMVTVRGDDDSVEFATNPKCLTGEQIDETHNSPGNSVKGIDKVDEHLHQESHDSEDHCGNTKPLITTKSGSNNSIAPLNCTSSAVKNAALTNDLPHFDKESSKHEANVNEEIDSDCDRVDSFGFNDRGLEGYVDIAKGDLVLEDNHDETGTEYCEPFILSGNHSAALPDKMEPFKAVLDRDMPGVVPSENSGGLALNLIKTKGVPIKGRNFLMNRLSMGSEDSNSSSFSDGHDSAVCLTDGSTGSTDSCQQPSTCVERVPAIQFSNRHGVKETDCSSKVHMSNDSLSTSDYGCSEGNQC